MIIMKKIDDVVDAYNYVTRWFKGHVNEFNLLIYPDTKRIIDVAICIVGDSELEKYSDNKLIALANWLANNDNYDMVSETDIVNVLCNLSKKEKSVKLYIEQQVAPHQSRSTDTWRKMTSAGWITFRGWSGLGNNIRAKRAVMYDICRE
jgi:hypothetical protein